MKLLLFLAKMIWLRDHMTVHMFSLFKTVMPLLIRMVIATFKLRGSKNLTMLLVIFRSFPSTGKRGFSSFYMKKLGLL